MKRVKYQNGPFFLLCMIVFLCSILLIGCDFNSTASKEDDYTEEIMDNAFDSVGLPAISNYFERSQLKTIYELRDDPKLICYWYTKNQYTGKWVFEGKCLGYGIPYGASMTSPEQYKHNGATLPQAEPNGIYTNGITSSATWILSLNEKGEICPAYIEQEISVRQKTNKIPVTLCENWSIPKDY